MNRLYVLTISFLLLVCNSCEKDEEIYVEYEVTGTSQISINITYLNENESLLLLENQTVPWSYEFFGSKGGMVYISAEKQITSGSVKVAIYRNSSLWKESTTLEPYGIVSEIGKL